ncbi:MAG: LamG-like jellyroll fold domain-containing protein [Bacteroidota bacterium]
MKLILLIFHLFAFSILTNGQVTEGLVGHFTFKNGSFSDLSGYQDCVLSTIGDSTYYLTNDRFGNPDYAINFQGAVLDGGINSRNITTEVTVSLWLMTTDTIEEVKFIVNKYYGVEPPLGYHLAIIGDSVTFDGRDNTAKGYMRSGWSETAVNIGEWHHVVGLAKSEGVWEIWVDGHKESSNEYGAISPLNHGSAPLGIAGSPNWEKSTIYKGALDDIRIYNRALDSTEINLLFNEANPLTSIKEYKLNSPNLNIYPNPFSSSVTIGYELEQPEQVRITFYNLFGKQIDVLDIKQEKGFNKVVWAPDNLPEGIYFIQLGANEKLVSRKVVLMR